MHPRLALGILLLLSACSSERHFAAHTLWPFGNPNAPKAVSETAKRAIGKDPKIAILTPQPGNVWPGPVQPMPTLSEVEKNANLPLGEGYTPSLPSPYPPGQAPAPSPDDQLYALPSTPPDQPVIPPVPGDAR